MSRLLAFVLVFQVSFVGGCGVEGAGPEEEALRTSLAREDDEESVEQELACEECSVSGADSDAGPQEVDAVVCVGGVCGVMKATLRNGKLYVKLPRNPSLIGETITAVVPGVGVFTGTYR